MLKAATGTRSHASGTAALWRAQARGCQVYLGGLCQAQVLSSDVWDKSTRETAPPWVARVSKAVSEDLLGL